MKLNKTFIFGILFGIASVVIVYGGYNFGARFSALEKAWRYPEVVRNLQVEEVIVATVSGQLK